MATILFSYFSNLVIIMFWVISSSLSSSPRRSVLSVVRFLADALLVVILSKSLLALVTILSFNSVSFNKLAF